MKYAQGNPKVLSKKRAKRIADLIIKFIPEKNAKVLDIGCSFGLTSYLLSKYYKTVTAIDVDKYALDLASKYKNNNLKFQYMNAYDLKFADNKFDAVILWQVHIFFKDQNKLFNEIYRVLAPGGKVLLAGSNKYRLIKPKEPVKTYYQSYWELKKVCKKFKISFLTSEMAENNLGFKIFISKIIWNIFELINPNFVWLLEKPLKNAESRY